MFGQSKQLIGFSIIIITAFCVSFVLFYNRAQRQAKATAPTPAPSTATKVLPESHLVDASGAVLSDHDLRKGKVVLVFMTPECDPCLRESDFLKTVVSKRNDVNFYGVISYGKKGFVLSEASKNKLPFKVFFDQGFMLAGNLGITRVPIKVFVEDGIIKKVWGGATLDEEKKSSFAQWLENLK